MHRNSVWVKVGAVAAGLVVLTLAGYLQYRAKIAAYAGAETLMNGERLGVTKMAEGMFNSIVMSIVLGTVVCVTVIAVSYVTRSVLAGACVFVLSVVPAGIFGSLVATYLGAHDLARISAPPGAASHGMQWRIAFEQMWIPGIVGLVVSFFAVRRAREIELRELNRPIILTREQREARDAELAERERIAAENRMRAMRGQGGTSAGTSAAAPDARGNAQPSEPLNVAATSSPEEPVPPPTPRPAAAPHTERRSIACPACGASNAPIRDRCLLCNAQLAPATGT